MEDGGESMENGCDHRELWAPVALLSAYCGSFMGAQV